MTETPQARCRRYRRRILEISQQTTCHVAPAFSCLEIVDVLYHEVMHSQDIFIMSKGHGWLAQLVVLEDLGKLPRAALDNYCRHLDSATWHSLDCPPELGGHPDYDPGIGIHASTGSLGHGLGIAAGQALAERLKGTGTQVYCLLSDGECQEGSVWEAAMVAANLRLDNLVALVDANDWGGMERMSESFPALHPLSAKFAAFGWEAVDTEGHNAADIIDDLRLLRAGVPNVLVCHTVKGRGVSFIEQGQPLWHYRSPTLEEYEHALEELAEPYPVIFPIDDDYCEICLGPCMRRPRHGEFNI